MRKYNKEKIKKDTQKIEEMRCNRCGRKIQLENGIIKEGVFSIDYNWGYFSNEDGQCHSFDLCEDCYEKIIEQFSIPVTRKQNTELI